MKSNKVTIKVEKIADEFTPFSGCSKLVIGDLELNCIEHILSAFKTALHHIGYDVDEVSATLRDATYHNAP